MSEPSELAQRAMDLSNQNSMWIEGHERLCAERYGNIDMRLTTLMKLIAWGGGMLASVILAVLGWSLAAQFNANTKALEDLRKNPVVQSEPRYLDQREFPSK